MVFCDASGWLYWTSSSAAAVRGARVAEPERAPRVRTVARLRPGARPRGIDIDPCAE